MASVETVESVQPKAKRPRCGRVTLDVGGEKFATSASTLTSNSHYFAALLSGDWSESGDEELYIDQDPAAFKVLLDYMRSGMIKVAEVNEKVLLLAEFLGMERLVSAAKIRWLVNLGHGPSLSDDCTDADIVAAFDEECGGISEAIGAGLFPTFLAMDSESKYQSDVAELAMTPRPDGGNTLVAREFVGREGLIETQCGVWGAISGLCAKGYVPTDGDTRYVYDCRGEANTTVQYPEQQLQLYRRRRYIHLLPRTENVFAPSGEDRLAKSASARMQYACLIYHMGGEIDAVLAPPEFSKDETVRSDPFGVAVIKPVPPSWVEANGFVQPKGKAAVADFPNFIDLLDDEITKKVEGYIDLPHEWGTIDIVEREILSNVTT